MVTFLISAVAIVVMLVVVGTINTWYAKKQKRDYLRDEYGADPALLARIENKEIWAGMTKIQLYNSQGDPKATDKLPDNVEIFKYDAVADKFRLRIRLENDVVVSWERDS